MLPCKPVMVKPGTLWRSARTKFYSMAAPVIPARRILVVDDEPLVCDSVKRMLAFYGHEVQGAGSGKEALGILEKDKFDLIVIDQFMPVMPGDELAAAIKSRLPDQCILMITASAERLRAFNSTNSSADLIVGKPFQMEELNEAINRVLTAKNPSA